MPETHTNYSVPEPPPIATDEPPIIDLVIQEIENFGDLEIKTLILCLRDRIEKLSDSDIEVLIPHLRDRKAFGIAKYGTPLQKSNGRDHRLDGLQELEDFVAYMKQGLERGDEEVRCLYYEGLAMASDLAKLCEGGKFDYSIKKKTVINPQ